MPRQIVLREFSTSRAVPLTVLERDSLLSLVPSIRIDPEPGGLNTYSITPGSVVGAVRLGDLEVFVNPKVPVQSLFFILGYAAGAGDWSAQLAHYEGDLQLSDAVALAFLIQFQFATRAGLWSEYVAMDDTASVLRGRLRFDAQIAHHMGRMPPLEVSFDDLSTDNTSNRLLKAASRSLVRLPLRRPHTRRQLATCIRVLADISDIPFSLTSIPQVTYSRLNYRLKPALELARLILRSRAFAPMPGAIPSSSFLIDMNRVVEDFIVVALREALGTTSSSMPQGAKGRRVFLDVGNRIRLEPDISWWKGPECRFVADIKYKDLEADAPSNADIYQLLSYTVATNTRVGLLIYAASRAGSAEYTVHRASKWLETVALDFSRPPHEILEQIRALAVSIRMWTHGIE